MAECIVTLGPATFAPTMWERLLAAGATGFRIPFSKETPTHQFSLGEQLVDLRQKTSANFRIIADLPGNQPRTSNLIDIEIVAGASIEFVAADQTAISSMLSDVDRLGVTNYPSKLPPLSGNPVLFGDGELTGEIVGQTPTGLTIRFPAAGKLRQRRGLTFPDAPLSLNTMGGFDQEIVVDARMAAFDAVMLSFVDSASDINDFREAEKRSPGKATGVRRIYSKVETTPALAHTPEIAAASDAVIIARGDLYLWTGIDDFYAAQLTIIHDSLASPNAPGLILATDLLESVGTRPIAARSDVSQLCAFIELGISGVLLSAETTIGKDPVGAVTVARRLMAKYGRS